MFLGVIISIDKGINVLTSTIYFAMIICMLDNFHLINTYQRNSVSQYLKISNSDTGDTSPISKLAYLTKIGAQSPYYAPSKLNTDSVLNPDGIRQLVIYQHFYSVVLVFVVMFSCKFRSYSQNQFYVWKLKYGEDFFVVGKDPNASKYKYNKNQGIKNYDGEVMQGYRFSEMSWKHVLWLRLYRLTYSFELAAVIYLVSSKFLKNIFMDLKYIKTILDQRNFIGFVDILVINLCLVVLVYQFFTIILNLVNIFDSLHKKIKNKKDDADKILAESSFITKEKSQKVLDDSVLIDPEDDPKDEIIAIETEEDNHENVKNWK